MTARPKVIVDGNEAAASVAHRASEVIAIYPITPSSTMGELADEWSAAGSRNIWGTVPEVVEMQSEAGAAGTVHSATLRARVPFLHFFDGFRTSHEVAKIEKLTDDDLRSLLDDQLIAAHRRRALTPDHPVLRGSAQNPDVFFQAREAVNPYYLACPEIVQDAMDALAARVGRQYRLFDYVGHPEAERVLVM